MFNRFSVYSRGSACRRERLFALCLVPAALSVSGCLLDFDRYHFSDSADAGSKTNAAVSTPESGNPSATTRPSRTGPSSSLPSNAADAGDPTQPSTAGTGGVSSSGINGSSAADGGDTTQPGSVTNADSSTVTSSGSASATNTGVSQSPVDATRCDSSKTVPFSDSGSGDIQVTSNADLEVLRAVTFFPRTLIISGATNDLSALECLETLGKLEIQGAAVVNLGLPGLKTITGSLTLSQNASLTNTGMNALTQVGGNVSIRSNAALQNLGLASLEQIAGDLAIADNNALGNVGLVALVELAGTGTVSNNPVLPACQVTALGSRLGATSFQNTGNDDTASCDSD